MKGCPKVASDQLNGFSKAALTQENCQPQQRFGNPFFVVTSDLQEKQQEFVSILYKQF
jgi:hypothetical protein